MCLKQGKMIYNHGKLVNIQIVYEISKNYDISSHPTLENCLCGAVTLAKKIDFDRHKYSGYVIGFDRKGFFSIEGKTVFGKNVMIFGVDMISSPYIDNKTKENLILGKGPT